MNKPRRYTKEEFLSVMVFTNHLLGDNDINSTQHYAMDAYLLTLLMLGLFEKIDE